MLKNRNFRIVLSLIIAVMLWVYVVGAVDPTTVKQIRGVPISMVHTLELEEKGLAVSQMEFDTVDIRVSGARATLNELDPADITARIDLSNVSKGTNDVPIKVVGVLNGVDVRDVNPTQVSITVEELTAKNVDVEVEYQGGFASGENGVVIELSHPQIAISGAKSLVDSVAKAVATIDASGLTNSVKEILCDLKAVDAEGREVEGVTLSNNVTTIKAVRSITKVVDTKLLVVDESQDSMIRRYQADTQLEVVGRADVVSGITTIESNEVNLSGVNEDAELPLTYNLPEGVALSEKNPKPLMTVTVSPEETKTITFTAKEIDVVGGEPDVEYRIPDTTEIVVTIKDSAEILSEIDKSDIRFSLDVKGLTTGSSSISLKMDSGELDVKEISYSPEKVEVTVEE